MEPNENETVVDETIEDVTPEEELAPETDWEAEAKKARGIAQRLKTKLEKANQPKAEPIKETPKTESKSSDLDYGQKAFLATYGIKGADELALVKTYVDRTGDDIDTIVSDDIFQAKLEKLRAVKETRAGIPSASKRSGQAPVDSVDYWLAKPFAEVPADMRSKVLNARIAQEKSQSVFSNNPIVEA